MWLFLKEGFYSVVKNDNCQSGEVAVRARCHADIDKLRARLLADYEFDAKIIDTPKADYACRVFVPKELMAKLMAKAVMDIDYDNFKGTIPSKDRLRHDAYFQCWEAMWGWQASLRRGGKGQSKAK